MWYKTDNNRVPDERRTTVYVGMGANLGNRREAFRRALALMNHLPETTVVGLSPLYYTDPVNGAGPGEFLNGIACLETVLQPEDLLSRLQVIEESLGRTGKGRGGPRTIDLDILLFGSRVIRSENLAVPHPKMVERAFVLGPFFGLAPEAEVPPANRTIADYWRSLEDKRGIRAAHDLESGELLRSAAVLEG